MNIFNGLFPVCFGQFYLFFGGEQNWDGDLKICFKNQKNGLCGTSFEGVAFIITGHHTGNVTLSLNVLDSEPSVSESAEEIVEASIHVRSHGVALQDWDRAVAKNIELQPGSYRIRYSAVNFGVAEEIGEIDKGDIESYTLDIWPTTYSKDTIVKVTREEAKYWHTEAQEGFR